MSAAPATVGTRRFCPPPWWSPEQRQLLCVGAAWLRLETRPRRLSLAPSPAVRRFFVQAIPGVFAGGIPQLKLMAGVMVASSSQAAVSWLYYANRLYELPLGVVSIAIASVLGPAIAASVRSQDGAHAAHTQSRALEIALGLSLPAAVAFAVLSEAIAGGLCPGSSARNRRQGGALADVAPELPANSPPAIASDSTAKATAAGNDSPSAISSARDCVWRRARHLDCVRLPQWRDPAPRQSQSKRRRAAVHKDGGVIEPRHRGLRRRRHHDASHQLELRNAAREDSRNGLDEEPAHRRRRR